MSIEGFCGGLGSGKTLRMSARLKEYYDKGIKIYANYNLHFPHEKIDPLKLLEFELEKCAVGLTEAYTFLDSRFSGSESSRFITYFLLQTRKRKVKILYDAQIVGSVDNRLRFITNRIYECSKMVKDKTKDKEDPNNIIGFVYKVHDDDGDTFYETLDIKEAKKLFDIYDTEEILLPMYLSPVRSEENLDEIIEMFNNSGNRETFMSLVRVENPYLGYDKVKAIYSLLKNDKLVS